MIYKKYGEVFKSIRKQQGFVITDFASIGIPKSTLSDFESGRAMISLARVDAALQRMGSGLSQFDNYLNNYITADTVLLLEEAEEAYFKENIEKLNELLTTCEELGYWIIYSSIKVILTEHDAEDVSRIIDFLYEAKTWGRTELYIYYIILNFLDKDDIIDILKIFKKNSDGICKSKIFNREIVLALCRASTILAYRGFKEESKQIIKDIEDQGLAEDRMFLRTLLYGTKGVWIYHFENKGEGREKIEFFLDIQEKIGPPEFSKYFKERYKKYI